MYKNLNLNVDTGRKPIEIPVAIGKMTDAKTSLQTSYKGRKVRQVSVLTADDVESARKVGDIECVVERSKTDSIYLHQKGSESRYITVDKETLKSVFPISRDLKVICTLSLSGLMPYWFDGTHYHLSLHGTLKKKVKVVEAADKRMFNILYHGLASTRSCFIARYVSFNREKFCAIYPDPDQGLIMSNLIHSNYFRQTDVTHILQEGETLTSLVQGGMSKKRLGELEEQLAGKPLYEVIFGKIHDRLKRDTLDPADYRDRYEELLKQVILKARDRDGDDADGMSKLDLEELIDDVEADDLDDLFDL